MEKNKLIIYTASSRAVNRAHDILLFTGIALAVVGLIVGLVGLVDSSFSWWNPTTLIVGCSLLLLGISFLILSAHFHGLWSLVRASEIYAADMMERYDVRDDRERERTNNESEAKKEDGK